MIFYVAIMLSICLFPLPLQYLRLKQKTRDFIFLVVFFLLLFILYFFKDESVGVDNDNYFDFFDSCYLIDYRDFLSFDLFEFEKGYTLFKFEKGYILFNKLVYDISSSHRAFSFALALVFSVILSYILKQYVRPLWMGAFLIFALSIYTNSFCLVRQSMAALLCCLSIKYILKRDFFIFIGISILAFFFHKTALIFIPLYFIMAIRLNAIYIIGGCIGGVLLGFVIHSVMGFLTVFLVANNYLDDGFSGGIVKYIFLLVSFLFIYVFLKKRKMLDDDKINFFVNMLFYMLLVQSLALNFSILTRLCDYFMFSLCVLYPLVISDKYWGKYRNLLKLVFVIFFIIYFCVSNRDNAFGFIPYKFITNAL